MRDQNQLIRHGDIVSMLAGELLNEASSTRSVPELVALIIRDGMWKDRIVGSSGQRVTYSDFKRFVESPPLDGLNTTVDRLMKLCEGTPAQTEIERLIPAVARHGGDRNNMIYNVDPTQQQGTSRAYRIGVLQRDAPDLAEQVISQEISAAEGMRRLKERQGKPRPDNVMVNMADVEAVAKKIRHHMSADQISELIERLQD